jgi:hypothetical protein
MNETNIYRHNLHFAFAETARMSGPQVDCLIDRFDKLAAVSGPETAFRVMHQAYAATDTERALLTVKEIIKRSLERFNKESSGVDINPVSRLRSLIERFNRNLDSCSVEINGVPLSKEDVDRVKVKIPGCMKSQAYTALAKCRDGKSTKQITI